jgi:hypothetical protein
MIKKKISAIKSEPYVPKPDNVLYLYRQGRPDRFTIIPYSWKANYHYILPLIPKHND